MGLGIQHNIFTRSVVPGSLLGSTGFGKPLCRTSKVLASLQKNGSEIQSAKAEHFAKNLVIPSQLLGSELNEDRQRQQTVYTIRFSTAYTRGSGLDEPYSGVQLCLVGYGGTAILHRVSPIFDPAALQAELAAINQVMDTSVGANRDAIAQATTRIDTLPAGKQRFQAGGVDEISFLGPEIGPIQSLMVAPEEGSWRLEEVTVSSSRSRHTDRFVCGSILGRKGATGFLPVVPPDAVVYGSGESVVILTRAQARSLHEAGMGKYSLLKERLLQANLSLVSVGTGLAWTFGGDDIAINFAVGGAGGLLYQWLLQKGVDGISLSASPLYKKASRHVPGEAIGRVVSSGGFRVAIVGIIVFCAIYGTRVQDPETIVRYQPNQVQQILIGAAGFLMYKLALIGVLTLPPLFYWNQPQGDGN